MNTEAARRWQLGLAWGNLLPAAVLAGGCYMLPLRWWGIDVPVTAIVALLLATTAIALTKPPLAARALRVAALSLLIVGAGLVGAFVLCLAFLSGVHGAFGNLGAVLMTLVVLLVAPYALLYPACQLLFLRRSLEAADAAAALEAALPAEAQEASGA